MEDNVDYSLLRHWRAQRWPALYAAAEADEEEFENRVADLAARLGARRAAGKRSNVVALIGPDDR